MTKFSTLRAAQHISPNDWLPNQITLYLTFRSIHQNVTVSCGVSIGAHEKCKLSGKGISFTTLRKIKWMRRSRSTFLRSQQLFLQQRSLLQCITWQFVVMVFVQTWWQGSQKGNQQKTAQTSKKPNKQNAWIKVQPTTQSASQAAKQKQTTNKQTNSHICYFCNTETKNYFTANHATAATVVLPSLSPVLIANTKGGCVRFAKPVAGHDYTLCHAMPCNICWSMKLFASSWLITLKAKKRFKCFTR